MKNQYFGDINDYKKFGLLRAIMSAGEMRIFIAWMLTENDGSTDGKFIEYLSAPEQWAQYDPPLYLEIQTLLAQNTIRAVGLIERSTVLNDSQYFSKFVPDEAQARASWLAELSQKSGDSDLIFLDPDNGLEIKSKKYGTKQSSKYLYWREVEALWSAGKSLLIYQHFIRAERTAFIQRMLDLLSQNTSGSIVAAFSTANVVFLLALQPKHHAIYLDIERCVNARWKGQIRCVSVQK